MGQSILLRGARQLLTLRGPSGVRRGAALGDLGIIEDGSVLIQDGVITQVGTSRRVENLKEARDALEIPAGGYIVMPAFVDANLILNLQDPAGSPEPLPKRRKLATFYDNSLALMRACLQHGTLTAEVKASAGSGNVEADAAVIKQLLKIGNNPIGMIRTWRIAESLAGSGVDAFRQAFPSLLKKKWFLHVEVDSEVPDSAAVNEVFYALRDASVGTKLLWRGDWPGRLAELIHRLAPRTICASSQLSTGECSILAAGSSIPVFSPCQEVSEGLTPGSSPCELIKAGAAIALSTGFHFRHSPSYSMQMALFFAVIHLRLSIEQAISAATVNAAHAVGVGHLTGSIEVGKRADLLLLMLPDYREISRQFGINHVGMAIREGNVVFNRTKWRVGMP